MGYKAVHSCKCVADVLQDVCNINAEESVRIEEEHAVMYTEIFMV